MKTISNLDETVLSAKNAFDKEVKELFEELKNKSTVHARSIKKTFCEVEKRTLQINFEQKQDGGYYYNVFIIRINTDGTLYLKLLSVQWAEPYIDILDPIHFKNIPSDILKTLDKEIDLFFSGTQKPLFKKLKKFKTEIASRG